MSTTGAQEPPRAQSSSPRPRYDSSKRRFMRSCRLIRSRIGSQRTIAAIFSSFSKNGRESPRVPLVLDRVLRVHDVALGLAGLAGGGPRGSAPLAGAGLLVEALRQLVA